MTHAHLYELPGWLVKKGSDTAKYRDELLQALAALRYNHNQVQLSANKARYLISEIASSTAFDPRKAVVYDAVRDFVYHYENYCMRTFNLREKVVLYINAALQVGFPPREAKISVIKPAAKKAGLGSILDKFDSQGNTPFGSLIKHRTSITHRISYVDDDHLFRPTEVDEDDFDLRRWCQHWSRNIREKAKQVDNAEMQTSALHHALAEKVIAYREPLRPSRVKTGKSR